MLTTDAPELHTERLLLRLVQEADLPDLFKVHSVDEVNRFLPYTTWRSLDDARGWFERTMARQNEGAALQFVVIDRARQAAVGSCLLFRFETGSGRAEVGYALGQSHWGGGYMREALTALINYAFGTLSLRRLEAEVDPRNAASDRLLLRLGFTREGLLRQRWVMKGEIKDAHIYGLLRDEWPGVGSAGPAPAAAAA